MRMLPALLLCAVAGCNATLKGKPAPELPADGWMTPDGPAAAPSLSGKWLLVEFFSPD